MIRRFNWLVPYAAGFLAFLYAPALLLPVFAVNDSSVVAFPLKGLTLDWFRLLLDSAALHSAALNSVAVAASASVGSTILGLGAARAIARHRFALKKGIIGFIMIPLVLPEIIVGVSMLVLLLALGLELSLWSIVLGHILICTPFSIVVLSAAFANLDRNLEEAAIDLGETVWSSFRRVTLPLAAPGIAASLLITFTISFDEFIIAFFLAGTETTLPVYIWSQLRFPARLPSVMALGTLILAASLALLVLAERLRRRVASASPSAPEPGAP